MRRVDYYNARRLTEFSTRSDLLEVVVGQHAIVLVDLVRAHANGQDTTVLGQRLQKIQDAWIRVLVRRSGPAVDEKQYRFERTVAVMVQKFIDFTRALVLDGQIVEFDQDYGQFYRFFSAKAQRACGETVRKFNAYVRFLSSVVYVDPNVEPERALEQATHVIITGTNLGSWLDVILN